MSETLSDAVVSRCPLFRGMTETERQELLGLLDRCTYAPGEKILAEGDSIQRMWILLSGKCRVTKKTPSGAAHELSVLEPFGTFGEMSFFVPAPHSATVTALTAVETVCLSRARYDMLLRVGSFAAYKLAFNTMTVLIERMRRMDEWVASLMERNDASQHREEWSDFQSKLYTGWQF
ncbi:MAG: Crp/Fnr family transcriptional regulator [Planctomycetaceae bacterium]